MKQLSICNLDQVSPGLNIEGGLPYQYLIRDNPNKKVIWGNIILVLDRPLIDNILFSDIIEKIKSKSYLLLENAIDRLNEHGMFATYLMIMGYYLEHGRTFVNKNENDQLNIVVHIHQDVSSMNLIIQLQKLVLVLCDFFKIDMTKINIDYRTDNYTFISTDHDYNDTDILLSFSQCAGLTTKMKPGDMILSNTFIPYDVDNNTIHISNKYIVENHLIEIMDDIIDSKYNFFSVNYVSNNYKSQNLNKKGHNVAIITSKYFHIGTILQVDNLWNPTNKYEIVEII